MKIYIASHHQGLGRRLAGALFRDGHEITSRWLNQQFGPTGSFDYDTRRRIANDNFEDICRCDALILVAGNALYSGGKFVEMGYAHALGKSVIIFGRRENMQCYGCYMKQVHTLAELRDALHLTPS